MKTLSWTVYPALAVIGIMLITVAPEIGEPDTTPKSEQDYAVDVLTQRDREEIFAHVRRKFNVPQAVSQKRTVKLREPVSGNQGR